MVDCRSVKKVFTEEIVGKRPRGGPRKKWIDHFSLYIYVHFLIHVQVL